MDCQNPSRPDEKPQIGEVTALLRRWTAGDIQSRSQLIELLYPELKKIADIRMRAERPDHTLQPTALVNEFFLQLARKEELSWNNRGHFLAVASQVMRRLLVDYSRLHNATKRGGGDLKFQIESLNLAGPTGNPEQCEVNCQSLSHTSDACSRIWRQGELLL